ncbi:MAG: SMP-30/gluconolactonase/LRE family protein [Sphingomonadaceae bacterium]|nr:SMP-30/gluconolactonase/LRE family protein [Sphingomonadaceae bacterium]
MPHPTRTLLTGLHFGEGPRWHDGRLWFSDFHAHAVSSVSLAADVRVEFEIDDQPSGLGWLPDGSLLVVSMVKRQLLRRAPDGAVSIHADLSGVATFHANDLVVDAVGRAFVGNFGFDLAAAMASGGIEGVMAAPGLADLALVHPDGRVEVAARGLAFPNGSVITPDGKTLIVAESFAQRLTAFDIAADGTLSARRVWAPTGDRIPDGIALDAAGRVWIANAAAPECVLIAEGGAVIETIATDQPCYACMLGGDDGRSLFMLTAPALTDPPSATPAGHILVATVEVGHAGRP